MENSQTITFWQIKIKWENNTSRRYKLISEYKDNAELLNFFFSNAVKNLKIPEFSDSNPLAENIPHPIFKAILKYKNQASIIAIKNARNGPGFYFCGVSVNDIFNHLLGNVIKWSDTL